MSKISHNTADMIISFTRAIRHMSEIDEIVSEDGKLPNETYESLGRQAMAYETACDLIHRLELDTAYLLTNLKER